MRRGWRGNDVLQQVDVGRRSLDSYSGVAPDEHLDELLRHAGRLRGARVLQLNATPCGGGVSELLRSGVPLLNDLGMVVAWKIIGGSIGGSQRPHARLRRKVYRFCYED